MDIFKQLGYTDSLDTFNEDKIAHGLVPGSYIINKFARNINVDGLEDIWNGGGIYTGFPTTAPEEFQFVSSDANDTTAGTGAQIIRVYYLDDNYNAFDENGDFLFFDLSLNGTTPVNSGVTGMRIWRSTVMLSGSNRSNVGIITGRWRTTISVIFESVPIGGGNTQLSNFTIPVGYTGYLKRYHMVMNDQNANDADLALISIAYGSNTEIQTQHETISTVKSAQYEPVGGTRLIEKTDIVWRALNVRNINGRISLGYDLLLVKN